MFEGPFDESIVKRAQDKSLVEIKIHNLRDWASDKRKTVDDKPYGGGVGMVMRVDVISRAIENLKLKNENLRRTKTALLSPRGKVFNQEMAQELSKLDQLILICGHYEGVDERVSDHLVDEEISLGDFVLTGGEIPAMAITDAVTRLIPGVLEKPEATGFESFSKMVDGKWQMENLLEFPHYTRPEDFKGWKAPEVLLSGDHKKIEEWRKQKALEKTKKSRPDLLEK